MVDYRDVCGSAEAWVGTPYHHQASLKGIGCDCLGLLRGVYRDVVGEEPISMPNYSPGWDEVSKREDMLTLCDKYLVNQSASYLRAGRSQSDNLVCHNYLPGLVTDSALDLSRDGLGCCIVFRMKPKSVAKHCGIVMPNGLFIHSHIGRGVVAVNLANYWRRRIVGVFAFPGAE